MIEIFFSSVIVLDFLECSVKGISRRNTTAFRHPSHVIEQMWCCTDFLSCFLLSSGENIFGVYDMDGFLRTIRAGKSD